MGMLDAMVRGSADPDIINPQTVEALLAGPAQGGAVPDQMVHTLGMLGIGAPQGMPGGAGPMDPRVFAVPNGAPGQMTQPAAPPMPPPQNIGMLAGANASVPMPPPQAPPQAPPQVPPQAAPQAPPRSAPAATSPADVPQSSLLGRIGDKIGDMINNRSGTLMALGAGLAGSQSWGQGISRGLAAAIPAQQADMKQEKENQTVAALIKRGIPKDVAMAAGSNPAIMAQLLPQIFGAKQSEFKVIGKDMMNNEHYGFVDPVSKTVTPYSGGAVGGGSGLAKDVNQIDSTLVGEDYLKQFSPEVQAAVLKRQNGDAMPTGNPRQGFTQTVNMVADKYGNDIGEPINDNTYNARRKMQTDLSSSSANSIGGILSNGKSAFGHLANLSEKYANLNNYSGGNFPGGSAAAYVGNTLRNGLLATGDQNAKLIEARDNALKYGQEATKFYAGSGGGEAERMSALHNTDPNTTSAQGQAGFLQTEKELMLGRLHEKEAQVRDVMGQSYLDKHPIRTPDLEGAINRIDASIAKLRGTPQAAGAPAAAEPAAPYPGARRAPDGHWYVQQDGKTFRVDP